MPDVRIPGPLGGDWTMPIDFGTLARVTSSLPGTLDFDSPLAPLQKWARHKAAGLVRRGAQEAAHAMVEIALEELRRKRDDLAQAFELIAALPASIRDQVAYEFFASFFDHYLPRLFLRQYVWGGGQRMKLTQQQMIDCNPLISLHNATAVTDAVAAAKPGGPPVPLDFRFLGACLTNGTLGQFTVHAKGLLKVKAPDDWSFEGQMDFKDTWDFDPKDFIKGRRSVQGELKTRLAHYTLPGQGFDITSDPVPFKQSASDDKVVWAGGTPTFVPDRVAGGEQAEQRKE